MSAHNGSGDLRLVTIRRGGLLDDDTHRKLALWAADCAEHVLHFFTEQRPANKRTKRAIEQARTWARGEIQMRQAREAAYWVLILLTQHLVGGFER